MSSNNVRTRFFFTVGTNLVRSLISFITGVLLARWLAPLAYGEMAFLLGTVSTIPQLLDMGSSTAFFTFLSQRPRSRHFVNAYFLWLALQFVIPLCAIAFFLPAGWVGSIWRGESRTLVLLAFGAAFMQSSLWPVIQQAGESQRQTIRVQAVGVVVAVVNLIAVVLLWSWGTLGLYSVFSITVLEYFIAAIVVHRRFQYAPTLTPGSLDDADYGVRKYLTYCLPFVPYTAVGFAYAFADRWLLQVFGGGVQQAYYAVAAQFSSIALIATTSILSIFWKEIAEAHDRGDHARTGRLYRKVSRLLFFIGAVCAGFCIPWSADLLQLILGTTYVGGAVTMTIMFLYPVHQSMGHIGSTMLYATERASVMVITGIVFMIASMVVTYLVLAPPDAWIPGLGLASQGLAIKMVVMQLIQVNGLAYIIARIWGWPFDWIYQPVSLIGCIGLGWIAHYAAISIVTTHAYTLISMALSGFVYLVLVAVFLYTIPSIADFTRAEVVADVSLVYYALQKIFRTSGKPALDTIHRS